MSALELLEKHQRAGSVIRNWLLWRMVEALQSESIDEEFKQYMRDQGIENDKIAPMIDANPRMLFDVFDENNISINIIRTNNSIEEWDWALVPGPEENSVCKSRKEAELFAIEAAFEILEEQLTPKEKTDENE